MSSYSRSHLADSTVLSNLKQHYRSECTSLAETLADLAEADERRLYLSEGYDSMHAWCKGELGMSPDAASKRIHVARTARRFPAIFAMLADGRLHLSAVVMLAGHITEANADERLAAAAHRSKLEIAQLLRGGLVRGMESARADVGAAAVDPAATVAAHSGNEYAPGHVDSFALMPPEAGAPPAIVLRIALDGTMQEKLRRIQDLLSHRIPTHDMEQVIHRTFDLALRQLEKRKFAATRRPRTGPTCSRDSRHIPAEVKRAVWLRDGGRCTFVGANGHRCEARRRLEFDHAEPFARGGSAHVSNVRLRCRAHNQYEADRAFGAEFMRRKRDTAAERKTEEARMHAPGDADRDVIPWLRSLGFRADEACRGASACEAMRDAPLEDRLRVALSSLARVRRGTTHVPAPAA